MFLHRMTVAYDGTDFCGWQVQPNGVSIQAMLQDTLHVLLKEKVVVVGSGRTDAGVHALAQVAHFYTHHPVNYRKVLEALNGILPATIRVFALDEAPEGFHARYSAIGKEYHYHLTLDRYQSPFTRAYSWHVWGRLDVALLEQGAAQLIGTHDFKSFANESHKGSAAHDSVRTLRKLGVVPQDQGLRLEFEGDGFLYKMVRNITGTLVEVAQGKRPMALLSELLAGEDRRQAGQAAPSHGLFLVQVTYPVDR